MTRNTLVIAGAVPFDGVTQRPQHFARLLAQRGWDVLYVDSPVTWLAPLRHRELLPLLLPSDRVREVPIENSLGRLRVLSPVAVLPFGNRYRFINRVNQRLLAQQIVANVSGPCILMPLLPSSVDLIPFLRPLAVVYDCVDVHTGFGGLLDPDVVNRMEEDLVFSSRSVIATSDLLFERMTRLHSDVHLIPNAAETAHFQTTGSAAVHPLLHDIPEPRVGLVGGIGPWVDLNFVAELADAKPELQFVIVGPIETDVSALARRSNVHFLGRQPYAELPQFLAGFAATLVSFVNNDLTQGVNPIKVYEYLAADKQVVSTPNHELLKLSELIWIAHNGKEAADAVTRILNGERKVNQADQQRFSEAHSWSAQVERVERALRGVVPSAQPQNATNVV